MMSIIRFMNLISVHFDLDISAQILKNLETTNYRKPFSNVSSMEPAVTVDSFSGLFRIIEVAFEDVRTFHADLRGRKWINFKERIK